jgi:outer membrane protein TolC
MAVLAAIGAARAQAVPEARVQELIAQAKAQVMAQQRTPAQMSAAEARAFPLTMEEAVKRALDQNIDLVVERLNPQLQDLALAQVLGAYRPTLNGTFGDNWNRSQGTSQLSGGQNIEVGNYLYNASVQQSLPWFGSAVSLGWTNTRTESTSNNATINPQYRTGLTASLTQPFMRNFKIDNTRQQLATTTISRENADVNLRALVINTVANTRNAYWDLVYAIQAVDVARTSLRLAEKLVEDNKTRVEIGTMAPIDVVSAQAEAATRRQALVQVEANRQTAELALKRLIVGGTSDALWNVLLNPTDRPATGAGEKVDLEGAVRTALEKRTDLIVARKSLQSNDISIRYLRNQMLPGLDLTATYGASGTGGTQLIRNSQLGGQVVNTVPGGYTDALSFLGKNSFPNWNVQLTFSYPIGRSSADVSYARAKVQYSQAQAQLRSLELQVATDVTNAALTVQSNYQQVQAAGAARELAQKKLEAEQSKFEVGMSTNYFVVQAQRDLSDSQNSELRAILNYRKSLVDYQRVQETSSSSRGSGASGISTGGGTTTTSGSSGSRTGGSGSSTGGL